jgi:hypothetical protein
MHFEAVLETSDDSGGRWVRCPFDGREAFGEARPAVAGTVNGTPFRSRLAVYGGTTYLGFTRAVRAAAGIGPGDVLVIELARDDAPREVVVPAELGAALAADDAARTAFTALAPGHRREWATWVAGAKRPETRLRRAASTVEQLRAGARGR